MKEFLTFYSIANDIRMRRTQFTGSFLVVEGDTDARFYKNFLEKSECQLEIAFNKENAIKILEILNEENFKGVIAIVDADFDVIEEKKSAFDNLFFTDFHDCECLILSSNALEKVLSEFGSAEKIEAFGKDIRQELFNIGSLIGYLRWISLIEAIHLTFEEIDFGRFLRKDDLDFDLNSFVITVINKSQRHELKSDVLVEKITNIINPNHDKRHVSCGKDLIEILSIGLQRVLGTNNSKQVTSEVLARDLRLAYEFEFFVSTDLYKNVKGWEERNLPFKIFR